MYRLSAKMQLACPRNYEPVCGTDDVTYPNECSLCREIFLNRAVDKKHDGRCVKVRSEISSFSCCTEQWWVK
uniref:Kazal-like domain-containing protein n=1 Tax=Strix occidentalis caurina TaxID=311401 RepID=A0A8D0L103_STROC